MSLMQHHSDNKVLCFAVAALKIPDCVVVKLEQVGQLVKQDGAGLGNDDLLYSNLCGNTSNQ